MKIKLSIPLEEYHAKFCKTDGQRMWASMIEAKSNAGDLEILETMPDGMWKTNVIIFNHHVGIPLEEQRYFEVKV
ncbi:hypothetical protein OFDDKENP_00156 [Aeromonas phage B614]|nr:hypothetical protein OFDDKENP_00156 [Aeromonas phage B614]UYD58116.1 hypothetical protein JNEOFJEA_00019 [Aeromonas phage UP87]UYD58480.1 hypothetical protein IPAKJDPM_00137 [Aeromonas phage avDM14-QBC]UYD58696.1 hypothetical protein HNNIDBEH_00103 [Aeromonas phage avDM10-HWA]UYD59001.1 hypothetical protein OFOPOMKI_00151 [Aeromonas phage avDM7-IJDJ]UYD59813.1 hypothetical protein LEHPIFIF_00040 [Aeromonas phage avDM9-HANS]